MTPSRGRDLRPVTATGVLRHCGRMDTFEPTPTHGHGSPAPLRRSRQRVLGGVCAGLAERLDVDPVLVRIAAVVIGLISSGLAVLAYLVAWVLIPPPGAEPFPGADRASSSGEPRHASASDDVHPREAWNAVGDEFRTLVGGLRTPTPDTGPTRYRPRSPLEAVDAAATEAGQRLRTPEVRDSARRLAASLSTAVSSGVDELGRRARRTGD